MRICALLACPILLLPACRSEQARSPAASNPSNRVRPAAESLAPAAPDGDAAAPLSRAGLEAIIGRVHGDTVPLPMGAEEQAGWLVYFPAQSSRAIGVAHVTIGERGALVLDTLVAHSPAGRPIWDAVDAIWLPPLTDSLALVSDCSLSGVPVDGVTAIVRHADVETLTDIRWATRVDTTQFRFVAIATDRVSCPNDGWGADP